MTHHGNAGMPFLAARIGPGHEVPLASTTFSAWMDAEVFPHDGSSLSTPRGFGTQPRSAVGARLAPLVAGLHEPSGPEKRRYQVTPPGNGRRWTASSTLGCEQ